MKFTNTTSQKIITKILYWGTQIIFVLSIFTMAYLSFVENVDLDFDIRKLTIIAGVGVVLNYIVYDSYYKKNFEIIMQSDIDNANKNKYSIHKRYYFARKGWKDDALRDCIREYNRRFVKSWIQDVEDICARTQEEIIKGKYRGNDHKYLIWRMKHRKYPKSGIRGPRDVLYLLSVGSTDGLKFKPHRAEHFNLLIKLSKLFTSILSVLLIASISVDFLSGNWATAIITLLLNIIMLFISLFMGSVVGMKAGKMKLSTVEEACEKLEEWKNVEPLDEPYSPEMIVVSTSVAEPIKITEAEEEEKSTKNIVELI